MGSAAYREPAPGSVVARTPFFTWDPIPDAMAYYVIVARDTECTEVIDVHFTRRTVYAPRDEYRDERHRTTGALSRREPRTAGALT